jgi:aldehyde:ferredoxin oxidoreductase
MPLTRKIAYIDLSTKEVSIQPIPEKMRQLYLGGRGIDMYLLYNHVAPGIDPMSLENVLLVSGGLLVGTQAPTSARCHIGGKSPLTGILGSSNMGGFFAPELAFAGFHHLVIKGKADKPVYLWVHNGEIEIRDASHLWGEDTFETQRLIREELGDDEIQIACIGQAGENLVRYAVVKTSLKNSGGRTGMGCLMGSKNLKAIAVRGTMGIKLAHPDEALKYAKETESQIMNTKVAPALGYDGTMMIWNVTNTTGLVRYRHLTSNTLEDWEKITIEGFHEKYEVGRVGCFGCPIHCRHQWRIPDGPYAGTYGEGPEYNAQISLGMMVNILKWDTILYEYHLCDKYGIDITELANLAAGAMFLYEKGIIDKEITGGMALDWDKAEENMITIIEQVAKREGFGALLADGMRPAIERFGKESAYWMLHVKGQAIGSDDRATPALALGAAVATRGWDHLRSRPAIDLYHLPEKVLEEVFEGGPMSSDFTSYVGKAREIWYNECLYAIVDSIGLCKFQTTFLSPHMPRFKEYAKLIHLITGLDISPDELKEIGERIYTLERMFNIREGLGRKDDYLPDFCYEVPMPAGLPIVKGKKLDREKYDEMLDEYYGLHGWEENGIPAQETLEKLGLDKEPSHML